LSSAGIAGNADFFSALTRDGQRQRRAAADGAHLGLIRQSERLGGRKRHPHSGKRSRAASDGVERYIVIRYMRLAQQSFQGLEKYAVADALADPRFFGQQVAVFKKRHTALPRGTFYT
jgi:hypothetical protein